MNAGGHEAEFLQLFAQEAEDRLGRLGALLLELERDGSDAELVASIFREVHTIKGAAAVVGLDAAGGVAHALEDLLDEVRGGGRSMTPELVDASLAVVDGLTAMLPRLVAGDQCGPECAALEQRVHAMAAAVDDAESVGAVAEPGEPAAAPSAVPSGGIDHIEDSDVVPPSSTDVPSSADVPASVGARGGHEGVRVSVNRLDDLVRLIGESAAAELRLARMIEQRLEVHAAGIPEFRDLSRVLNELQEQAMRLRMVAVSTITDQLHRAVRDLARSLGKHVQWEVRGGDTELDRDVLQRLADPLVHLIRNAIDHGIESPEERRAAGKPEQATVRLHAMQLGSEVILTVTDDGRGIDVDQVRAKARERGEDATGLTDEDAMFLIFRSGLSTAGVVTEVSGRGVGLDVVRASLDAVRGRVEVRSTPGSGSEFRIIVPITLALLPCLLVVVAGQRYAIPLHSVIVSQAHDPALLAHAEGRPLVWVGESAVPVSTLQDVLGIEGAGNAAGPIVVVAGITRRHAFRVDALLGQRDVVVKGLGRLAPRLDVVAGASVEPDGSILLVLDGPGLIERARGVRGFADRGDDPGSVDDGGPGAARRSILVVDDALTVRELQRSILERAGFEVRVASDGVEAMALLAEAPSTLVMTDVEMPRMDGFELTTAIRAHPSLANIPVLILTSRSSEADRQRGLDVGADGYIVKSSFDETTLLAAVDRLLGSHA